MKRFILTGILYRLGPRRLVNESRLQENQSFLFRSRRTLPNIEDHQKEWTEMIKQLSEEVPP